MVTRYIYIAKTDEVGVEKKPVAFDWYPGFSVAQKQKSIRSLHENARKMGYDNLLEISSKSPDDIGVKLSAFSLKLKGKSGLYIFMESVFQGSKVFEHGGPYVDLYTKSSVDAKKDSRLKTSGNLIGFCFKNTEFPIKPRTLFYDWLYVNILYNNRELLEKLSLYQGFTDIEFNPQKSINCQAYSAALLLSLIKNNLLDVALSSVDSFKFVLKKEYAEKDKDIVVQSFLF